MSNTLLYLSWTLITNVCIPNISVNSIQICLCQPWRWESSSVSVQDQEEGNNCASLSDHPFNKVYPSLFHRSYHKQTWRNYRHRLQFMDSAESNLAKQKVHQLHSRSVNKFKFKTKHLSPTQGFFYLHTILSQLWSTYLLDNTRWDVCRLWRWHLVDWPIEEINFVCPEWSSTDEL